MKDLKITLFQSALHWHDINANLTAFENKINQLTEETDLIILPEMFTTGFTMDPESVAESMDGLTMHWMEEQATKKGAVITGSLIIKEGISYYNRLIWMHPGGMYHVYDKRHLFAMAGEDKKYKAGEDRLIVNYKGWRICPMICYDLRFPVWSRNDNSFDVLIYVANWPNKRGHDWQVLLNARAIENQCYVVGVNRVGTDVNGHDYNGDSCVIDPGWRKTLFHQSSDEIAYTTTLSASHLEEVRSSLPFLKDQGHYAVL